MKKSGVIVVFVVLMLFSISFISAGWFSDTWNKITGKVTEGNETATCTDSDGGKNYYVGGEACSEGQCSLDGCHSDGSITEAYCEGNSFTTEKFECPYGCSEGACVEELLPEPEPEPEPTLEPEPEPTYSQPDLQVYKKDNSMEPFTAEAGSKQILFAKLEIDGEIIKSCDVYVSEGKKADPCTDMKWGFMDPYTYEVSENECMIVPTSQGNIFQCVIDVPETSGETYVSFSHSSGGGKRKLIVYKCGDGKCNGPETKETCCTDCGVLARTKCVNNKLELIPCDGCLFDTTCIPFGIRRENKYCSDTGAYLDQKTEGAYCDNNFECKSNVCVSGECVSGGLIKKIIDWFKRLFGIEPKSVSDCEQLTNSDAKNECYTDVAIETGDASLCEKTVASSGRKKCYWNVAQETENTNLCEKMIDVYIKRECYYNVAIASENISLCEKITGGWEEWGCYTHFAVETEDVSICEKITDGSRDICYDNLAQKIKDASLCERIIDSDKRERCYATVTNDANLCEKISESEIKDLCYRDVALTYRDSSLCEKIIGMRIRDECYLLLRWAGDDSLCEKITEDSVKDQCYAYEH